MAGRRRARGAGEEKKRDALIVAALPTNELTTVGRIPVANPCRPNSRSAHFSARASRCGTGCPATRRAGNTHVDRTWYTTDDGYRYRCAATPSAWMPRNTPGTVSRLGLSPAPAVAAAPSPPAAPGAAELAPARVWNGVALLVNWPARAAGLVLARVSKLAVWSRVLTMSNG